MNITYSLQAWNVLHARDRKPWPGWQEALDDQMRAYFQAVGQDLMEPWQGDLLSALLYPSLYRKASERQAELAAQQAQAIASLKAEVRYGVYASGRQHGKRFTLALLDEGLRS